VSGLTAAPRRAGIWFVLVTVLLDVMGVGLIIPVLPALVGEFATSPDAIAYWYGALGASYGLMQFLVAPSLGALSDQFGRRKILLLAVSGLGLSFMLMGLANSLLMLLLSRMVGGAFAATVSVSSAYIADIMPEDQRSRGFGLIGAMFGLGFIIGPIAGGLLGDINLRWPFYGAALLCLVNLLFGFFVLPESLAIERRSRFAWARANPFSALRGLSQTSGLGVLVVAFALTNLSNFILHSTFVLFTTQRFNWTPSQNGLAMFVVGVASVIAQGFLLGRMVKRWGERQTALISLASASIALVAYGLTTSGLVLLMIILVNLCSGLAIPALKGIISRSFDASRQGSTLGTLDSINGLMTVVGPILGTVILAQVAHVPANDWRLGSSFYVSALLQAICWLLVWRWRPRAAD
jgi:MFS transporter, DHA1 family, tetracycline resistance protein